MARLITTGFYITLHATAPTREAASKNANDWHEMTFRSPLPRRGRNLIGATPFSREELDAYIAAAPKPIDVHEPNGVYGNGLYVYDDRGLFFVRRPRLPILQRVRSGHMREVRSNTRWMRRHRREL